MTDAPKIRMTSAEFLKLPTRSEILELIGGEIVTNPPTDEHQAVVGNVYFFLRQTVKSGNVRIAPTVVNFDGFNLLTPDVFWVSAENDHCSLFEMECWIGAPDLIVEVMSHTSVRNDRIAKFLLYEKYGVREYWIINLEMRSVEVWCLVDKTLTFQGVHGRNAAFTSRILAPLIETNWLFDRH